jgi:hypothetical protein
MKRTLKFKDTLPLHLEQRLIHKYGYSLEKRSFNEYFLFSKEYISDSSNIDPPFDTNKHKLSNLDEQKLIKQCDNICLRFPDPYAVPMSVRARLTNMSKNLRTLPERQFILEYMDENFPIEGIE